MTSSRDRWQPCRAVILNVYQYEDETLDFADGRLLLRGVNGSGKSTAMNMLLPFLLEADARRIDAAGEQTGVLKSWMLADTEETQRTGYLWIEFVRPDAGAPGGQRHHTVGCGIRAGRHTDRVTTWWFSTPRRAKIDFPFTERNIPLSAEALRVELGADAVYASAVDYRAEIRRRFFGGCDPSGYLSLLHQVRNPRVGDRIDADLPERLREALPPVPEDAPLDAAQPLEDLEDHRRNVTALTQTDRALTGVLETYRAYARRVAGRGGRGRRGPAGLRTRRHRHPTAAERRDPGRTAGVPGLPGAHRLAGPPPARGRSDRPRRVAGRRAGPGRVAAITARVQGQRKTGQRRRPAHRRGRRRVRPTRPGRGGRRAAAGSVHLSTIPLRSTALAVPIGTRVLVVENPRLVEAAAQRRLPAPVLTTSGNATTAPLLAIHALRAAGAELRYHGDFDAAGLAMTARLAAVGATPWRMDRSDYHAALAGAAAAGVRLPTDPASSPDTSWDPELAAEFDRRREIVHEERTMDALLTEHGAQSEGLDPV